MTSVDVHQLREGLNRHLAEVRQGATITVTDHGTPVARLSPVGTPSALERLIAEGVVQVPTRRKRPAPDPVIAEVSLSQSVIAHRR